MRVLYHAKRFWKVAAPYWFSEDKVQAWSRLISLIILTGATTGISLGCTILFARLSDTVVKKEKEEFTKQLLYNLAAYAGGMPIFSLRDYVRKRLALRWRIWMTSYYLDRYLQNKSFYKIESESVIDNPDQRIVADVSSFTETALALFWTLLSSILDTLSFGKMLYAIYPPLLGVLLLYSIVGTAISAFIGRGLVTLNFLQEKKEADFRFGMISIRENAESIAFYGGEENEKQLMLQRFKSVYENMAKLLITSSFMDCFTNLYERMSLIVPVAVIAPLYIYGKIEYSKFTKSTSSFSHLLGAFSLIVYQFKEISAFFAIIGRLVKLDDFMDDSCNQLSDPLEEEEIRLMHCSNNVSSSFLQHIESGVLENRQVLLHIDDLTLKTPLTKGVLFKNLSLTIYEKDHMLLTGPSGSGKTSLLRAIAGLWSKGSGEIRMYVKDTPHPATSAIARCVFFLPQRPYMVLGTLRQQLLYPTWAEDSLGDGIDSSGARPLFMVKRNECLNINKPTTKNLVQVLEDVRLSYVLSRFDGLDSTGEWSSVLSLGEQQRLAFARVLLSKPSLVLLDESTSALDEANEAHLYQQLDSAGITYVSVGHRKTLYQYHSKVLHLSNVDPFDTQQNWCLESVKEADPVSSSSGGHSVFFF